MTTEGRDAGARVALVAQVIVVAAAAVALAIVLRGLRQSGPVTELAAEPPVLEAPADPVTCQRSLPDVPLVPPGDPLPPPVGRVTSSQVLECPRLFDGRVVEYVGEVIGDVLRREGGAWVLVNDDEYALGDGPLPLGHERFAGTNTGLSVWLAQDLARLVDRGGDHDFRGTILAVRGTLLQSDPDDGGGLTLRAAQAQVVAPAVALPQLVHRGQALTALVLSVAALGLLVGERLRRRDPG